MGASKTVKENRRNHWQVKLLRYLHQAPQYTHNAARAELLRIYSEYVPIAATTFIDDRINSFIHDMIARRSEHRRG